MVHVDEGTSERELSYLYSAELLYLYQCAELLAKYEAKLLTFNVGLECQKFVPTAAKVPLPRNTKTINP